MKKLKIVIHFIKIKLHKIGNILIKTAAAYAVVSFGIIQVASIATDNLSTQSILGISSESFMQLLFIIILAIFPIVLIISYFVKRNSLNRDTLIDFDETNKKIDDYRPKIGLVPFENLNKDSDGAVSYTHLTLPTIYSV